MTDEIWSIETKIRKFCRSQKNTCFLLKSDAKKRKYVSPLPNGWSPFLAVVQSNFTDVYAIKKSGNNTLIAVWADHAFVREWKCIEAFQRWLTEFEIEK